MATIPRLTGSRCACRACGELFNSVTAFDMHRVGYFDNFGTDRRCRTMLEMVAAGMSRNSAGFWITEARGERHARALAGRAGAEIGAGGNP